MADPVFTVTKIGRMDLPGESVLIGTITSDGGTYAAGGFVLTPVLNTFDRLGREPSIVLIMSNNGYKYEYDPTTKKLKIRVATSAATNAAEAEHTAAAVVSAARTGIYFIAVWAAGLGE
jgi:hypothetical protein